MTDLVKVQALEAEIQRLKSEIQKLQELVKKVEQQRDGIYWEYETIRYNMNEQLNCRTLANIE
jgi:predicted  nucleic acid-binding Zn-ribbon protein